MKYSNKRDRFEAANVWFSQSEMIAKSYDWWVFVKAIEGVIYFNDYNYSPSTIKHQIKVRRLLSDLGIGPFITVSFKPSLEGRSVADIKRLCKEQAVIELKDNELKRVARNEQARLKRVATKATLGGVK